MVNEEQEVLSNQDRYIVGSITNYPDRFSHEHSASRSFAVFPLSLATRKRNPYRFLIVCTIYDRIIESFGLEGTSKNHLFQYPWCGRGHNWIINLFKDSVSQFNASHEKKIPTIYILGNILWSSKNHFACCKNQSDPLSVRIDLIDLKNA